MPVVTISIFKGYSVEFKNKIHNAIHSSIVTAFQIPGSDFNQKIHEYDKDNWKIPPGKSGNFIHIEVFIFPGRTKETKKKLYKGIIAHLEEIGIKKDDVIISLIEVPMQNWAIRGGIPADEVDLGYETNI